MAAVLLGIELEIDVPALQSAGNYQLIFDMVSENLAWFEDLGSDVLTHNLIVE